MSFLKKMTPSQVCLFIFLVINIGCSYVKFITLIQISYIFLLLGVFFTLRKKYTFPDKAFLIWIIAFVFYSFISILWSFSEDTSLDSMILLFKAGVITISFYYLLQSKDDLKCALLGMGLAGMLYAIFFLFLLDFDISLLSAGRFSDNAEIAEELPNLNVVSMYASFSFIYFLFMFFYQKRKFYLIFALIDLFLVFTLGSRKSIISILICLLLLFPKLNKSNKLQLSFFVFVCIFLVISFIPYEYISFVSERLSQLNFLAEEVKLDRSDEIRVALFEHGVNYCFDAPFFGNGFYVFSQLFKRDYGLAFYSHNNFIETFVGGGFFAFVLYYGMYVKLLYKMYIRSYKLNYSFLCFLFLIVLLFNHIAIVVLLDRCIWLLFTIIYAASLYLNVDGEYE